MTAEISARLTRIPLKAQLFERETYLREALAQAQELWGERTEALCRELALILIKPDGIAFGQLPTVLSFLHSRGFHIVASARPMLTRLHWREMWRYQLTSATLDRLAVNDLVLRGACVLLLLHRSRAGELPASVELSVAKGSSDPRAQPADCLRRALGQANRVLSFIHVADEPADLLRELGILLDTPERQRVLRSAGQGEPESEDRLALEELATRSQAEARPVDPQAALARVGRRLDDLLQDSSDDVRLVRRGLALMQRSERIAWRPFAAALSRLRVTVEHWDLAMLASQFIEYDEPGHPKRITAVEPSAWAGNPYPS
ncbi:MAG: nucleoside-diphosphate kinase [Gammaproteobacteria bacterium]